jgi:bifunctional enzyme CysN/CysC
MLDIRYVALAVNKMDLVDWSQLVFDEIEIAYRRFAQELGLKRSRPSVVGAGRSQRRRSAPCRDAWYKGQSLCSGSKRFQPRGTGGSAVRHAGAGQLTYLDFRGFSGASAAARSSRATACASALGRDHRVKEDRCWYQFHLRSDR